MIIPSTTQPAACLRTGMSRLVPEEVPVALVYGGTTQAVMMATPADLEDLAVGFSLTEGIVNDPAEIENLVVVPSGEGIELRMWLRGGADTSFRDRRRHLAGPTGCGLCGIESLAAAARPVPRVQGDEFFDVNAVPHALDALCAAQSLSHATRATHAAGLYRPGIGLIALREDVGRHNALDKLAGTIARSADTAEACAIVITSRVSLEMVQKAAMIGAPVLIAMSAPTALAIRTADVAGITLLALARGDSFQVFTHARRVEPILESRGAHQPVRRQGKLRAAP